MDRFRAKGERPSFVRLNAPLGLRVEKDAVEREGGQYGAGVIRGFSVLTVGEAQGHRMWIDEEFLTQVAGAFGARGVKSRFTHPGLSSDGLGKQIGRAFEGEAEGGQVRADLHIQKTARKRDDYGGQVLDWAAEDPESFGASIVFDPAYGEMDRFVAEHSDEDGHFTSPDEANTHGFPHVRLARLKGVDLVGDPAANPGGLFSADELPAIAEEALAYALGLTEEEPDELLLGVHPERVKTFVQGFMARHGVALSVGQPEESGTEGDDAMTELKKASLEELRKERPDLVGQLQSEFAEETDRKAAADVAAARTEALAEGASLERVRRKAIAAKAKELRVELADATVEQLLAADTAAEAAAPILMQRRIELLEAAAPKSQGPNSDPEAEAVARRGVEASGLSAEEAWQKGAVLPDGTRIRDEFKGEQGKADFLAWARGPEGSETFQA